MFAIENLRKSFVAPGNTVVNAVDGISLGVETGKLLTLLGPSGCGKTTTLRCLAGLERPQSGKIVIANKTMFDSERGIFVSPSDRGIGMVFQSYAIWPHMTVFENVAFPLRVARDRRYSASEIRDKVRRALDMVRMSGFETRPATQLSGGQQQRLAFARGLVREPQILLLDEPLSNLDAKLREQMRVELKRLQKRLGITTVYVTHDQSEALALSDEIAVFSQSTLEALRQPLEAGEVSISRVGATLTYPCRFTLVAAMNPCPCGYYGDSEKECKCSAHEVMRYQKKISGPLLDRIDIQIKIGRIDLQELQKGDDAHPVNSSLREQVERARKIQTKRFKKIKTNTEMSSREIQSLICLHPSGETFLKTITKNIISPRSYYRLLKVARTIADLEGSASTSKEHLAEAFSYRLKEEQ